MLYASQKRLIEGLTLDLDIVIDLLFSIVQVVKEKCRLGLSLKAVYALTASVLAEQSICRLSSLKYRRFAKMGIIAALIVFTQRSTLQQLTKMGWEHFT